MPSTQYKRLEIAKDLSKGATVDECIRCGSLVYHRLEHNKHHSLVDQKEKETNMMLKGMRAQILELQVEILKLLKKEENNDKSGI